MSLTLRVTIIYRHGYPNWKTSHIPALIPLDQRLLSENKSNHLLRKANIYFKLQYWLFNHKKKEKNSDLTVVTSCAKNVRYKNGSTTYWSCLQYRKKEIQ